VRLIRLEDGDQLSGLERIEGLAGDGNGNADGNVDGNGNGEDVEPQQPGPTADDS
jgi:hypothetical protein